jgi:hypothetical protein
VNRQAVSITIQGDIGFSNGATNVPEFLVPDKNATITKKLKTLIFQLVIK